MKILFGETMMIRRLLKNIRKILKPNGAKPQEATLTLSGEDEDVPINPDKALASKIASLTVGEVMVPRADIVALSKVETLPEVAKRFVETKAIALPVFRRDLDDIIGAVSVHTVLTCGTDPGAPVWNHRLSPISFVPGSQPALDAFVSLSHQESPFLLVVDEHGGVDGLVSKEALVKALGATLNLWEDEDESEILETVEWNGKGAFLIDGRLSLEAFEEEFQQNLHTPDREDDIETIGGLVCSLVGRVPMEKEVITHPGGCTFEIVEANARRIKRLAVTFPKDVTST